MTRTAFERDNILSPEDRLASARKCLALLASETGGMGDKESAFVEDMETRSITSVLASDSSHGCVTS